MTFAGSLKVLVTIVSTIVVSSSALVVADLVIQSPPSDHATAPSDLGLEENLFALLIHGKTKLPRNMTAEAKAIVKEYDNIAEEIRLRAAGQIRERRLQAMRSLKELQDTHTRAAQLDEAVAIRDTIRNMIEASFPSIENPGTMSAFSNQLGKSFLVRVTGRTGGTIYGSAYYTSDSDLATACVHSGILEDAETGMVVVTMISAREPHVGSLRHGIRSHDYGVYSSSYALRRWKPSAEEIELASLRLE